MTDLIAAARADGAAVAPATAARPAVTDKPRLDAVVPGDPWARVRIGLMAAYVVGYVWWFFAKGLIVDRISVMLSVMLFIGLAHVGRPLWQWRRLTLDVLLYVGMWIAYDESRGWADGVGMPLQVETPRNIDRFLFFGHDPNVWLQRRLWTPEVRWYDILGSITYFTHFIVPVAAAVILWVVNRRQWVRYVRRFATVVLVACVSFVLLPTAPPWMAASTDPRYGYRILPPLRRTAGRGWNELGLSGFSHAWETGRDWVNPVAAMPSLHAAYALFVVAFFLPQVRWWWLKAVMLLFPLLMATSLVYFGEHYVADALAGWLLVGGAFWFWGWYERRQRSRAADRAIAVLP